MKRIVFGFIALILSSVFAHSQVTFDYNPPSLGSSEVVKRNDLDAELDGINSAKQNTDSELTCLAGLTSAADKLFYFTGSGTCALVDFNSVARSLIDDTTTAAMRATLGLVIGTNVQAYDADLDTWAGVTSSANGRSLVSAADYAAMRTLLSLVAGTDFYSKTAADAAFQPLDADLTTLAAGSYTDPNLDQLVWWDDSQGRFEFMTLADMTTDASPAAGDYLVVMDSTNELRKVNWSSLPGSGGGITAVVQDTAPKLGGALDTNGFNIEFGTANTDTTVVRSSAGNISVEGNVVYRAGGTDVPVADGGTGASTAATGFDNLKQAATETYTGVVELATTAEATTGTDTVRAVTPAGVAAALAAGGTSSIKRATKTSGYTLVAADRGATIEIQTNSVTLSVTAAATLGNGWWAIVKNGNTSPGANTMTIDPNASETIDGLTTSVDYPGATRIIYTNGTAFFSHLLQGGFAKFTASGTFTIPPNLSQADVICYGAGGGGGGGGGAAAGSARASGAGGAGGAKVVVSYGAVALGSAGSGVTVTVGTGGTGGTGVATAAGNAGTVGGTSSFGSLVSCYGGGPGGGTGAAGTAQTGGSGGGSMGAGLTGAASAVLGGSPAITAGAIGFAGMGAGANTGADGSTAEYGGASGAGRAAQGTTACAASTTNNGGSSLFGGGGGGNGGCIASGNVASGDGVGGSSGTLTAGGGGATGTNGATCTNGAAGTAGNETFGGFGGGGGGSDTDSTGCTGGAGGVGGGGGGGGGGGTNTGGTGGAGGDGSVYVRYSWLGLPANDNQPIQIAMAA